VIRRFALPVLIALAAACTPDAAVLSPSGYSGLELDTPVEMPDLTFTDTEGNPFNLREGTAGKTTLLFFGYTSCPDICPVHLANIAAVLGKMTDEVQREIRVVFVTTDPARDTLPRLRQWIKQFDPGFIGLTGPDSVIVAAERALGVAPAVIDSSRGANYLVQHSSAVIAFTRDGMARVHYPFGTRQRDWGRDLPRLVGQGE
jgi:protein SCO1/2